MNFWKPLFLFCMAFCVVGVAGIDWFRVGSQRFYIGAISPDGSQIITHTYSAGSPNAVKKSHVRDTRTGEILFDITDVGWAQLDSIAWWPDGRGLGGIDQQRQLVSVRLTAPQLFTTKIAPSKPIATVFFFSEREYVMIVDDRRRDTPRFALIDQDGQILRSLHYGTDESIYAYVPTNRQSIQVVVWPDTKLKNWLLTDGKHPSFFSLAPRSGEIYRQARGKVLVNLSGLEQFVAVQNPATGNYEIQDLDDDWVTRFVVPSSEMALHCDGTRLLTQSIAASQTETMLASTDIVTGDRIDFVAPRSMLIVAQGNTAWLDTTDGRIVRLNLDDGTQTTIANARPRQFFTRPIAYFGVPFIGFLGIGWIWMGKQPCALEGLLLLLCACGITIFFWWQLGDPANADQNRWLAALTQLSFGCLQCLGFVWLSTLRSIGGRSIPIGILSSAAVLLLFHRGISLDVQRLTFALVGAGIAFWMTLGLVFFSYCFGRIGHRDHPPRSKSQITLWQLAVAVSCCGILFAVARRFEIPPDRRWIHILWPLAFAATFAFASLWGVWCGFRFRSCFLGLGVSMAVSLGLAMLTSQMSEQVGYMLGRRSIMIYGQLVVCCLISCIAMQMKRREGFQLACLMPDSHIH